MNRSATDTIKGYFYQFDYTIKKLLELDNENNSVVVERIEDVDIKTSTEETAVQCKYYAKTEYNHSVIAKPIRYMLTHYINLKQQGLSPIKYLLYGYYAEGQSKLSLPLPLIDFKDNFLIYTHNKTKHFHHIELNATDNDLIDFLSLLTIDINAQEYDNQLKKIFSMLTVEFNCSNFEAEQYFYNNALRVIKQLSIQENAANREISKKNFLIQINNKEILFNQWFIEYKGLKNHFKELKKEFFTNLNTSPFDRFFLIEIDTKKYLRSDLKELILLISKKWSKISRRETNPFCPYLFLNKIDDNELINLKIELQREKHIFIDGFDFNGAPFCINSIMQQPNCNNSITIKFINKIEFLDSIISSSRSTIEIYQFYLANPFYVNDAPRLKHIKIQINEIKNIKEII